MGTNLKEICKDIRCDTILSIGHLGVGHIGGCLSVVELLAVLYFEAMRIDPRTRQSRAGTGSSAPRATRGLRCTPPSPIGATSTGRSC